MLSWTACLPPVGPLLCCAACCHAQSWEEVVLEFKQNWCRSFCLAPPITLRVDCSFWQRTHFPEVQQLVWVTVNDPWDPVLIHGSAALPPSPSLKCHCSKPHHNHWIHRKKLQSTRSAVAHNTIKIKTSYRNFSGKLASLDFLSQKGFHPPCSHQLRWGEPAAPCAVSSTQAPFAFAGGYPSRGLHPVPQINSLKISWSPTDLNYCLSEAVCLQSCFSRTQGLLSSSSQKLSAQYWVSKGCGGDSRESVTC